MIEGISKAVIVIMSNHARKVSDDLIARALCEILEKIGFSASVEYLPVNKDKCSSPALWIFMGKAHRFLQMKTVPVGIKIYMHCERVPFVLDSAVVGYDHLDTSIRIRSIDVSKFEEPLIEHRDRIKQLVDCGLVDWVFEYNPHNDAYWNRCGIQSLFVPMGYHRVFEMKKGPSLPGVLFFATLTERRRKILDCISEKVRIARPFKPAERSILLGGHSVGVHISRRDGYDIFPDRRMALFASNDFLVVSENCDWTPTDSLIECGFEEMPSMCKRCISGEFDKKRIEFSEWYKNKFKFESHIKNALQVVLN